MSDIPDKKYYRIGEVSALTKVTPSVLRYWEKMFKELHPVQRSRRRYYTRNDITLIQKIRHSLYEQGYTVEGAKKLIAKGSGLVEESTAADTPRQATSLIADTPLVSTTDCLEGNRDLRAARRRALAQIKQLSLKVSTFGTQI